MEKNVEGNKTARLILSTRSLNSDKKQSLEAQQAKKNKKQKQRQHQLNAGSREEWEQKWEAQVTGQGNAQRRPRWKEIRKEAIKEKKKKEQTRQWVWWCRPINLVTWEHEAGGSFTVQGQRGQFKEDWGYSSMVECLSSTQESMSSSSIIVKTEKERKGGSWDEEDKRIRQQTSWESKCSALDVTSEQHKMAELAKLP